MSGNKPCCTATYIFCCARKREETGDAFGTLRRVRNAYTILGGNLKGGSSLGVLGVSGTLVDNIGWI
jgi:hypothetical protein